MQEQPVINPLGSPFIELSSIGSTNNYALAMIRKGAATHGTAFFAHEQTAGKGQMGRQWKSAKDANIALSIVLQPRFLRLSQQFQLSACIAVAVREFLANLVPDAFYIKWPNDLYWRNRKIGGILIENIVGAGSPGASVLWQFAVAGTGLNINQSSFPPELPNPVSLKQITAKEFDTVALAKELCGSADHYFTLLRNNGFGKIFETYNAHLYKKDEPVTLKKGNIQFNSTIKGVSATGQLITDNGQLVEEFEFGEIAWLLQTR